MESNGWFIISLIALVALSAFFSASETAYTGLNRARLKNMANGGGNPCGFLCIQRNRIATSALRASSQ